MNAIIKPDPTTMAFGDMERLAAAIAKSGLFGMRTPEQALVLMMISHAEGRHPALAARDYDIVSNRPAKKSEAMLRDFLSAGGTVEWHELSDETADATFKHPAGGSVRIVWDMKRATAAGLASKDMYKKFPRQMLRSRVVSEGVRTVFPLATSGLYVPEEVADIPAKPEHNGPTIEHDDRDAINDEVKLKTAAADMKRPPSISEKTPPKSTPGEKPFVYDPNHPLAEPDPGKWILALDIELANAQSRAEVLEISSHPSVEHAVAYAPNGAKRRVAELLHKAYARFAEPEAEELPEVEIEGADKVAAG